MALAEAIALIKRMEESGMKIDEIHLQKRDGKWHLQMWEKECVDDVRKTFDTFADAAAFVFSVRDQGDDPPMTEAEQIAEVAKGRT